ncbi:MAG: hypothetical protein GJU77_08420 [Ferrovum sp.]|jgi:hypothetical protein|nr:hypothetical protein [Ferrovum sp.]NDU89855.1 hypothetical protein [Ferrovum sp.]
MANKEMYTRAEQLFMTVLGDRCLNEAEKQERDSLLGVLKKAGFEPDEPSNAAHVLMLAWSWAHGTSRADVLKLLDESKSDLDRAVKDINAVALSVRESPSTAFIDAESVAKAVHAKFPTRITVDLEQVKAALRDSFSILWAVGAGVLMGVFFWFGTQYEHYHQAEAVASLKTQISNQQDTIRQCLSGHRK